MKTKEQIERRIKRLFKELGRKTAHDGRLEVVSRIDELYWMLGKK